MPSPDININTLVTEIDQAQMAKALLTAKTMESSQRPLNRYRTTPPDINPPQYQYYLGRGISGGDRVSNIIAHWLMKSGYVKESREDTGSDRKTFYRLTASGSRWIIEAEKHIPAAKPDEAVINDDDWIEAVYIGINSLDPLPGNVLLDFFIYSVPENVEGPEFNILDNTVFQILAPDQVVEIEIKATAQEMFEAAKVADLEHFKAGQGSDPEMPIEEQGLTISTKSNEVPPAAPIIGAIPIPITMSDRERRICELLGDLNDAEVTSVLEYGIMQLQDDIRKEMEAHQRKLDEAKAKLNRLPSIIKGD